jgi:anaerobic selenocysteine-containing dehydrogenase
MTYQLGKKIGSSDFDFGHLSQIMEEISPVGVVFMTFHFAESPANLLTNPALDPVAKIPEYKVCAVRVERV